MKGKFVQCDWCEEIEFYHNTFRSVKKLLKEKYHWVFTFYGEYCSAECEAKHSVQRLRKPFSNMRLK